MSPEPLRAAMCAVPFRPFSLVVSDGERLAVPVPDRVSVLPKGRIVAWLSPHGHTRYLDINVLVGIEMENSP